MARLINDTQRSSKAGCGTKRESTPRSTAPPNAIFRLKMAVVEGGASSATTFTPIDYRTGYTLVDAAPETGRLHQIRVHAAHIGHAVAGDKLYGPDESLFIEFIEHGWTPRLAAALPIDRQALHASSLALETHLGRFAFEAPLSEDLQRFWSGLDRPRHP